MIEIRGTKPATSGMFGCGVLLAALGIGSLFAGRVSTTASVVMAALGMLLTGISVRALLVHRFQLRATEQGVAFASSRVVAWRDIDQIFVSRIKVRVAGAPHAPPMISITFHRKRTLFQLPITYWITSPFSVGDVDIALYKTSEPPYAVVANLDALRGRVVDAPTAD